jgi:hypothetical protein
MTIAALVIAAASFGAAGLAALFTWLQAHYIGAQLRDSRLPTFEGVIEDMSPSNWYRLRLRLTSPRPLSEVMVHIPDQQPMQFSPQNGVPGGEPNRRARWYENELVPGQTAMWRVEVGKDRAEKVPEQITLRIDCAGGRRRDSWTCVLAVDVPPRVANGGDDRITV